MSQAEAYPFEADHPVILLVDDQPRNLQLLGNGLLGMGYDIIFAESGKEALGLVEEARPGLILLDVMMPEMDGYEVCRRIRDAYGEDGPAIIFVTARGEVEDIAEGLKIGAVDYMTKPIQIAEVKARVKSHLDLVVSRKRLIELNRHLEKDNREQRFFLSVLSHDLRAPLSGVEIFLDDLLGEIREILPSDALDGFETILGSISSMNGLLEELLQWARYQKSRDPLSLERFDLVASVEEILRMLHAKVHSKDLKIDRRFSGNLPVACDLQVFGTVMRNLLSNAIKFSIRGGVIGVGARRIEGSGKVRIEVRDSGVGMTQKQIAGLFDSANRGTTLGTEREKGSGLGMILCQSLLEKVGSRLEVESEIDKGSCFWFDLPEEI